MEDVRESIPVIPDPCRNLISTKCLSIAMGLGDRGRSTRKSSCEVLLVLRNAPQYAKLTPHPCDALPGFPFACVIKFGD
jgi:hypothetical protein